MNTFGIDASAKRFSIIRDEKDITTVLDSNENEPVFILGGGSNILFTKDFDGLVIKNEIQGFQMIEENKDFAIIESGAGEVWHEFVMKCIDENLGGIENLSLIPGNVGASPMQNIGAYGVEVKDIFRENYQDQIIMHMIVVNNDKNENNFLLYNVNNNDDYLFLEVNFISIPNNFTFYFDKFYSRPKWSTFKKFCFK